MLPTQHVLAPLLGLPGCNLTKMLGVSKADSLCCHKRCVLYAVAQPF